MMRCFFVLPLFAILLLTSSVLAGPIDALNRFLDRLDAREISKLDTNYVMLPAEWWQFGVFGMWMNTNLNLRNYEAFYGMSGNLDSDMKMRLGVMGSFRGWGASYSWDVKNRDQNFSLSYHGNAYGLEFVNSKTKSLCGKVNAYAWEGDENGYFPEQMKLDVKRKSVRHVNMLIDGYYVFDSRHFSFPAALDQSYIQKKSAGSFILGSAFVHSKIQLAKGSELYELSEVEQTEINEVAVGAGYGYNFVYRLLQNSRFLIHFSVMPMFSVWNNYTVTWNSLASDDDSMHDQYWLWDDFKNDQLQIIWFLRTSFTYMYKRLYAGIKAEVTRQTLSKGEDLDLEADLLNIRGFVGFRF